MEIRRRKNRKNRIDSRNRKKHRDSEIEDEIECRLSRLSRIDRG